MLNMRSLSTWAQCAAFFKTLKLPITATKVIHWAGKTAPSRCRKEQTGSRSLQKWTPSTICKLQFYLVKSMCPHCKIYLSNLLNALVKIAKCIYQNWWIYLSKLQEFSSEDMGYGILCVLVLDDSALMQDGNS